MTEGATLAQAIGRPYIEVACRAYQAFPSVSLATARERGRHAVALAEHYGLSDRPVLAPALGAVASIAVWTGEFEEGERWLRRGWEVVQADIDPAVAVLLHLATGMLHAGRGEHQAGTRGVNRSGAGAVASQRCAHSRTRWSPSGWRPHRHVSGCQTKGAPRSTSSPPNTNGWTPSTSGEQQSAWRKETLPGR